MKDKIYVSDISSVTVAQSAVKQIDYDVATCRACGIPVIKVLCGSNEGRAMRSVARRCRKLKEQGKVELCIPGTEFQPEDPRTRFLTERLPFMADDPDLGQGRDDIAIIYVVVSK